MVLWEKKQKLMSGRGEKRQRVKDREKANKKKRTKRTKLMSDEQIQAATKKELQIYQRDNPEIFRVDFSNILSKIRMDFLIQQAVFEAKRLKRTGSNIDDEDDDSDDDEEDDASEY